jgi:3-deoxy-D-manno-octulosonate 8-phosphate phosphatase (KDO 8-P phosphatase)
VPAKIKKIRLIAMDVDGVLTDGLIYYSSLGNPPMDLRGFHVHDGVGIALAREAGVLVALVSSKRSRAIERRARDLGVTEVLLGKRDKWAALKEMMTRHRLSASEVCYIGDDLPDLPVMKRVGFPVAVANAVTEVKKSATLVTKHPGGQGAVREAIEFILRRRGDDRTPTGPVSRGPE